MTYKCITPSTNNGSSSIRDVFVALYSSGETCPTISCVAMYSSNGSITARLTPAFSASSVVLVVGLPSSSFSTSVWKIPCSWATRAQTRGEGLDIFYLVCDLSRGYVHLVSLSVGMYTPNTEPAG